MMSASHHPVSFVSQAINHQKSTAFRFYNCDRWAADMHRHNEAGPPDGNVELCLFLYFRLAASAVSAEGGDSLQTHPRFGPPQTT